uniref:Uncharacterized protein n=1 Tax=Avena sativa TaxID=4498 RepID=A0ACD5Z6M4_AVESA
MCRACHCHCSANSMLPTQKTTRRYTSTGAGAGMARSLTGDALLFSAGAAVATALLLTLASPFSPRDPYGRDEPLRSSSASGGGRTFYDDPELTYTMDRPITRWDEKRADWLRAHPELSSGGQERVLMVSGSQPTPCRSPVGDHLLMRLLKNKADYCRLNDVQLLYNTALLRPSMDRYWAKIPVVRAAMVAHPEAE